MITLDSDLTIAVIGLGYVGLPLALLFSEKYKVIGYDTNPDKVRELNNGIDPNQEITQEHILSQLKKNLHPICFTSDEEKLQSASIYIITVPTPIDKYQKPDLTYLFESSKTVSKYLSKGNIIIYESTVYPGVTEDECVPILSKYSNLQYNEDFYVGYSPERINPGDKVNTIDTIIKITSGSTPEIADFIDALYKTIIKAGTYKVSNIKIAEASKVIENAQRDVNIAFVNELAQIFSVLQINTQEVLAAARTKWNFLDFRPGLVGGHCIGVDPFYLAEKAKSHGYYPNIILNSRKLNDAMPNFIAKEIIKLMIQKNVNMNEADVLLMGLTFKENCSDIRNSKVIELVEILKDYNFKLHIFDPHITKIQTLFKLEQVNLISDVSLLNKYEAIVLCVAHDAFKEINYHNLKKSNAVIYDVKGVLGEMADKSL
jgi:UDP-N-acetyl-D-galactosamine dehydrogenase